MLNLYHVQFLSPFHVGNRIGSVDETDEYVHSDTLSSAVIDCAFNLTPDSFDFANQLKCSSIFYCYQEKDTMIYLIPRPLQMPRTKGKTLDVSLLKKLKKQAFISTTDLSIWLDEQMNPNQLSEIPTLYQKVSRTSAVTDRISQTTIPFTRTGIKVLEGIQGYFLMETNNALLLKGALKLLEHTGIGGIRSSGFGQVAFEEIKEIPSCFKFTDTKRYYSMSLFRPDNDELKAINKKCSYKLEKRSYWFKEGVQSDRYTFFKEGSMFNFKPEGLDIFLNSPSKKFIKGKPVLIGVNK